MTKTFPILYSRNTNGSVQQWSIEVDGPRYRSTSGQVNGALTSPAWTDCIAKNIGKKNEVSADDQAVREAESKWKDKIKTEGYREDITKIDDLEFREPMRAQPYHERKHKLTYPFDGQYKLDGFRSNPQPDTNIILSRYNNPIVAVPHINALLAQFHAKHPDVRLDGELYSHEHREDFNKLCSILKQQKPTPAQIEEAKCMEFWVFDIIDPKAKWIDRFARLKELFKEWHPVFGRHIRLVWTTTISSEAEYDTYHKEATTKGFEGTMARNRDALYAFKRTDDLQKRKDFYDSEYPIVGFEAGRGNKKDKAAKVVCMGPFGKTFKANIIGDWTYCKHLLDDQQTYIGQKATIKYTNLTPKKPDGSGGVPRQGEMKAINKI